MIKRSRRVQLAEYAWFDGLEPDIGFMTAEV